MLRTELPVPKRLVDNERDLEIARHRGRAADDAGVRVQRQPRRKRRRYSRRAQRWSRCWPNCSPMTAKVNGWPTKPTALNALVIDGGAAVTVSG